jgi:hypothetical protein
MDLHLPKAPIRSFRDVFGHVIAVALGVLVALIFQQGADYVRHARLAAQAEQSLKHEILENRGQVTEELANMAKLRGQIEGEIANLQKIQPGPFKIPGIAINLTSSTSWETALATQAVNYLPYETVHLYADAYNVFRLLDLQAQSGLRDWQEIGSFGDDLAALSPDQRQRLLEALRRYGKYTFLVEFAGQAAMKSSEFAVKSP